MKTNQPLLANLSTDSLQKLTQTVKETVAASMQTSNSSTLSSHVLQSILRGRKLRGSRVMFDIAGNTL